MGLFDDIPMAADRTVRPLEGTGTMMDEPWIESASGRGAASGLPGPIVLAEARRSAAWPPSQSDAAGAVWAPPGVFDEWWKHYQRGMRGLWNYGR